MKSLAPEEQLPVKPDDPVTLENIYHLRHNFILSWDAVSMHDEEIMVAEMVDFKASGGSALVDMSVPGLRTDIEAIRRISEKSGVHVVATTGLYSEDSWPDQFKTMSVREYERYLLGEVCDGIEGTKIKAGHLKAAIEDGITDQGEKLLKAIAHVSDETGLSASIHHGIGMSPEQVRMIVKILLDAGMNPEKTLMCHMQNHLTSMDLKTLLHDSEARKLNLDFNKELLDKGLIVGHDCFGHDYHLLNIGWYSPPEWMLLVATAELCKAGYAGQIVLGTDRYLKILTRRFGGGGYCHLTEAVVPQLEMAEVSKGQIEQMTIKNPVKLLSRQ
jgi:phosphotriesterase-related protein